MLSVSCTQISKSGEFAKIIALINVRHIILTEQILNRKDMETNTLKFIRKQLHETEVYIYLYIIDFFLISESYNTMYTGTDVRTNGK